MEPTNDLIAELKSETDRYNQLFERYNEFIAQITLLKRDERFTDIEITRNPDDSLTITFLDRELLVTFRFSTIHSSRNAYINCYLEPHVPETEIRNIHSFSFDVDGVADIGAQMDHGSYKIHEHKDAVNILAYWLKLSLDES